MLPAAVLPSWLRQTIAADKSSGNVRQSVHLGRSNKGLVHYVRPLPTLHLSFTGPHSALGDFKHDDKGVRDFEKVELRG